MMIFFVLKDLGAYRLNPLSALGGKRCLPVADPKYTRVQSVFFRIFVCKINVVRLSWG